MNLSGRFASINRFLLDHNILIRTNPAVSPDMTLDFDQLCAAAERDAGALAGLRDASTAQPIEQACRAVTLWPKSRIESAGRIIYLIEHPESGDCGWIFPGSAPPPLADVRSVAGLCVAPCSWDNLIRMKNLLLENDPGCTVFPRAEKPLDTASLGIGARFTTLHWPAVAWCMRALNLPLTANQNSIPRELVYDVNAMVQGRLAEVPFPFIGRSVPEGHQGQSVQGMSHASVLTLLKYGFHRNRIPWGFNADHQPIGGRFDVIEKELAEGGLFASYITFDLSPELSLHSLPGTDEEIRQRFSGIVDPEVFAAARTRLLSLGIAVDDKELRALAVYLSPAMRKMQRRNGVYEAVRRSAFTTEAGRRFFRELSIDELPGETTPQTLAVCLAMAEAHGVEFQYVAPNIGFQKNAPYPDNTALRNKVAALFDVAKKFGVSFGFHSGSGKSAENYRVIGEVTGGRFEVKTSGRYTYEMGVALSQSSGPADRALWQEWYAFARDLAVEGAFSGNETQKRFAREFITRSLGPAAVDCFQSREQLTAVLNTLQPSPDHMFWFEYNFLYVLAGNGDPGCLGDHSPAGYRQRARFYAISDEGRLLYAKQVAQYILFLAETTGIAAATDIARARKKLSTYTRYEDLLTGISAS